MTLKYNKRVLFVSVILVLITVNFWSGSRYPSLKEKTIMGGADVGSIGIVFFYDPDRIKVELWGPVSESNYPQSSCD